MKYRLVTFLLTVLLSVGLIIIAIISPREVSATQFNSNTQSNLGSWVLTGSMSVPHSQSGGATLTNGKVLVAGGYTAGAVISYAEVYDPATGLWSKTGNLKSPRTRLDGAVIALKNGKALAIGGTLPYDIGSGDTNIVEIFDPTTGQWDYTGFMSIGRRGGYYMLLDNGKVLAAAGAHGVPDGNRFLTSAELYDPTTGQWSPTGSLRVAREGGTVVKLADGRVMLGGGEGPWFTPGNTAEIYDPATGQWSWAGPNGIMPWGWFGSSAVMTLLADGRVLLTGGTGNQNYASAAIYDPVANSWKTVSPMSTPRVSHKALRLPDGRVMVYGGHNGIGLLRTTEIYDPATNTWTAGPNIQTDKQDFVSTQLLDGKTLIVAGWGDQSAQAELYTPDTVVTPDTTPPVIKCDSPDGLWHNSDVALQCTASDAGSGLANPADASFTLATSVPANTETANAVTASRQICDKANNCATAGPVSGNKVDKKGPSITITSPVNGAVVVVGQSVKAAYSCSDGGSGIKNCDGPVANGSNLDTATQGLKSFTVNATDQVGNPTTQTLSYTVAVQSCVRPALGQLSDYALLDPTKGSRDSANGLANIIDVSPPGNGTADGTYWRWINTPKAVALQADLGTAKTVNALKLFTQTPTKAPNTYFQYSQDGQVWSDVPGLSSVNAGESYGQKSYPVSNITARYFRVVIDNTSYLTDVGYFSDLQVCTLSVNGQAVGHPTPPQANPFSHRLPINSATASQGNALAALDNVPWTGWVADGKPTSAWLQVDLGQNRMVTGLSYYVTMSAVALHTKIEYSTDGTNWTTLPGASELNTAASYGAKTFGPFAPVTARYIRFTITNPENNWALGGYGEVDVLGYPVA